MCHLNWKELRISVKFWIFSLSFSSLFSFFFICHQHNIFILPQIKLLLPQAWPQCLISSAFLYSSFQKYAWLFAFGLTCLVGVISGNGFCERQEKSVFSKQQEIVSICYVGQIIINYKTYNKTSLNCFRIFCWHTELGYLNPILHSVYQHNQQYGNNNHLNY